MENLKIRVSSKEESREAQELLFELGYEWHGAGTSVSYLEPIARGEFEYLVAWKPGCFSKHVIQMGCGKEEAREVTFPQLRDMVVLYRNDVNDATHVGVNNKYYLGLHTRHVWSFDRWVITDQDFSELTPITKKQPDAVASPNDIARTAEDHREHNLANELNDLCAEFGCLPGVDRMAWLRGQLRIAKTVRILGAERQVSATGDN